MQYATAKIGVILVNINPAYRTHEVQYALEQSGCRVLISATEFKTSDYVAMVDEVRPQLPRLERVDLPRHARLGRAARRRRRRRSTTSCAHARRRLDIDDPINIQYTSGTTGFPKGATLSHHNILNNGFFVGEALRLRPSTTASASRCPSTTASGWCSATSPARRTARRSSSRRRPSSRAPRSRPSQDERCTSLYGVPTMFIAELEPPRLRLASISRRCGPGSWPARRARSR